jgi:UPF0755 protein
MGAVRKIGRFFGRLLVTAIILFVFVTAGFVAVYLYVKWPVEHPTVEMRINPGASVRGISDVLDENGIIKCAPCFRIYITIMGYSAKLRAGDYAFESGLSASGVVQKLLTGDFKTYRVTVVEGWRADQIADHLKTLAFVEGDDLAEQFRLLVKDPQFIKENDVGWEVDSLEGYLFPSTYEVYKLKDPKQLAQVMVGEFKERFSEDIKKRSGELGLTPQQVVTLASIVEKETGKPEERPLIASVFYNRLKKGMLLQSDPTIIYGIENFDGNLRKRDLTNPHKYNTYVHPGLPPGPIANPGEASIRAVLNPAKSDYLFFVSKNDGSHIFAQTLSEHNKNVWEYQKSGRHKPVAKGEE